MQRQLRTGHSDLERTAAAVLCPARTSPPPNGFRSLDLFTGLAVLLLLGLAPAARSEPAAAPAAPLPNVSAPPPSMRVVSIESLTLLPDAEGAEVSEPGAAAADRAIAAAVEAGSDPSLEAPDPFRKRDFDLIRGERDVEIGGREMELRWRVRPKTKETISLELRF